MTTIRRLSLATAAAMYVLIVIGGVVRVTGSGLGCPDWPMCHGQVIPPFEREVLIEYTHRLAASVVGLLVLATLVVAWLRYRQQRSILWPATAASVLLVFQVILGGITVLQELPPEIVTAHLATALATIAMVTLVVVSSFTGGRQEGARSRAGRAFMRFTLFTAAATYVVMLSGSLVVGEGASLACQGWPLCNGSIIPSGDAAVHIHFTHRALVALVGLAVLGVFVMAWRDFRGNPPIVKAASAALLLYAVQVVVGAGNIWSDLSQVVAAAHLAVGTAVWLAMVVLAVLAYQLPLGEPEAEEPEAPAGESRRGLRDTIRAYVALSKPRIIFLLLVTTVPAMVLAQEGMPSPWLILATLIGGTLAAGGAHAVNCYVDRDIDRVMSRTQRRPLPRHEVPPERALIFGLTLGWIGFLELAALVNVLSAMLALSALVFYVLVYSLWLKRTTPQNIVIGGAAGAIPPLVGWAAVTNSVGLPALILFAIIFMWTPPHFWALALRFQEDYRRAGVPMLPVVKGADETRREILVYTALLVGVTLLLFAVSGAGYVYLLSALLLGGLFLARAYRLWRDPERQSAMKLFHFSITYLALLFAAMVADV
ncbi:MAG TPA: heme o synthase, partial [Dehalococcoidia bacterium]